MLCGEHRVLPPPEPLGYFLGPKPEGFPPLCSSNPESQSHPTQMVALQGQARAATCFSSTAPAQTLVPSPTHAPRYQACKDGCVVGNKSPPSPSVPAPRHVLMGELAPSWSQLQGQHASDPSKTPGPHRRAGALHALRVHHPTSPSRTSCSRARSPRVNTASPTSSACCTDVQREDRARSHSSYHLVASAGPAGSLGTPGASRVRSPA